MEKKKTIYAVMTARKTMQLLGTEVVLPIGHYFIAAYDDIELAIVEAKNANVDIVPLHFKAQETDINKEWMED